MSRRKKTPEERVADALEQFRKSVGKPETAIRRTVEKGKRARAVKELQQAQEEERIISGFPEEEK